MELKGRHIGLAIAGSSCTFAKIEQEILKLKETGAIFHPIISGNVQIIDSRFGDTSEFISQITHTTGNDPTLHIEDTEPIGSRAYLDVLLVAPCIDNTLTKLANGVTDTPVLMVAKAHLRNTKPLIIPVSTSDTLGINFKNIGELLNSKSVCFVPFGQGDPVKKPSPAIIRTRLVENTLKETPKGRQIQPVIQG